MLNIHFISADQLIQAVTFQTQFFIDDAQQDHAIEVSYVAQIHHITPD
ncbi:Uncharacterised protein [Vibrio cholerae]|uniref:Uncharacterized protein n=1 Tax=Vibrio cholerae TaxID=666 RepID=A0A655XKC9_VIBCL|nr:Uncharacterised protein [Vibrio cholerae]